MNEFWAIVLGAALATVSGIIGALVNEGINKRRGRNDLKRGVYEDLLFNLNCVATSDGVSREEFNKFTERVISVKSRIYLYGSEKIKKTYNDFVMMAMSCDFSDEQKLNGLRGMIEIIASQMKNELGFNDKESKAVTRKYEEYCNQKKK